jgi:glucosamine-phosphate N-acetyltransferase
MYFILFSFLRSVVRIHPHAFPSMRLEPVDTVPGGFKIRLLEAKDYDSGYLKLLEQLTVVGSISESQFTNTLEAMKSQNKICIVMCKEDEVKAIGSVMIESKLIHHCQKVGHIEDIVVDESCRGLGLGKVIIDQLVHISKSMGCYKTVLTCAEKNIGFYQKCGFEQKSVNMAIYFE